MRFTCKVFIHKSLFAFTRQFVVFLTFQSESIVICRKFLLWGRGTGPSPPDCSGRAGSWRPSCCSSWSPCYSGTGSEWYEVRSLEPDYVTCSGPTLLTVAVRPLLFCLPAGRLFDCGRLVSNDLRDTMAGGAGVAGAGRGTSGAGVAGAGRGAGRRAGETGVEVCLGFV